jgi:cell wall-associated NlpC family hydrolase
MCWFGCRLHINRALYRRAIWIKCVRKIEYKWGGSTPATGFDAAGLVQYAYDQVGIHLPRTTNQQVLVGSPVAFAELVPGDLVFFRDRSGDIYHVGMYASDGRFLHAPFTGDVVKYDSFSTPYYGQRFATGRRVAD